MAALGHRRLLAALMTAALLVSGCGNRQSDKPQEAAAGPVQHRHEHAPPHGGTLVELGDEFAHLEFVFEQPSGRITVFVLDGEAEQPIRIADGSLGLVLDAPHRLANRPLELAPVPNALTGETAGNSSEFTLERADLSTLAELSGRVLSCRVRGQVFRDVAIRIPVTIHQFASLYRIVADAVDSEPAHR